MTPTTRLLPLILGLCAVGVVPGCGGAGSGNPAGSGGAIGSGGGSSSSGGGTPTGGVSTGGVSTGGSAVTGGTTGATTGGAGGHAGTASSTGGAPTMTGGAGGGSTNGGDPGGHGVTAPGGQGGTAGVTTGGVGGGQPGTAVPAVTKDGESLLSDAGLTIVSYGGYLNGESFQQDGVVTYNGYQYAAFWNTARHVVLARRALPTGAWARLEFTDYTNSEGDAHNTISLGICPGDGTLHLAFDHHGSALHYRKSIANLVTAAGEATWAVASFSAVTSALVTGTSLTLVTYPRFVTEPDGTKMLFGARIGESGSGDELLWEYRADTHAWSAIGRYINGTGDSINAYPHGLSYTKGGTRLHVSWCWRETSDAATNHDLLYAYSDDHGRTWKNNAGANVATTGTSFITKSSPGIKVWTINQNRGLINQEHMTVDAVGRVHVLLSHLPDAAADQPNFDMARTKGQYFHYWRNPSGTWTRSALGLPSIAAFRGKLAVSSSSNVYAILPDLRVAGAAATSNFATWSLLHSADAGRFFSDPLIDTARLMTEDRLTVVYPQKNGRNIYALEFTLK